MESTFNSIDPNRIASTKQVYGVACHFANLKAKDPSERYGLTKVFYAVLNKFYDSSKMTHAEATDFFTRKRPLYLLLPESSKYEVEGISTF